MAGLATCKSGRALFNLGQPFAVIFKIGGSYKWSSPYPLVARPTEPNCKLDTAWGAVPRFNEFGLVIVYISRKLEFSSG